ncbi:MAG: TonB-dependent receptor [Candidatus Marinimicrobia bacterium]|nr:TonB-dependent receptor [Candidatus Neomarinimicrobiota bacterium]
MTVKHILILLIFTSFCIPAGISGFVRNSENGEPIPFATVIVQDTELGTSADIHGYYVLQGVPSGDVSLIYLMIGFSSDTLQVQISGRDSRVDAILAPQALTGEEIQVSGERAQFLTQSNVSNINLTARDIRSAPAFIEDDIFRTFQLLPGVTSQNDFSAAIIVRGGSPDENLVLLDTPQIYNPYHVGGIFSTFNTDAISNARFISGGFQSEYGGHLSSVISLTTKEGNSREGRFSSDNWFSKYWNINDIQGDVTLLSSKFLLEGPSYKGSWFFSGRRTYFDQLASMYYRITNTDQNWNYYFWDTNFKIHSELTSKHRITYTQYSGLDDLSINIGGDDLPMINFLWDWGNRTRSIQWRYLPSSKIVLETNLSQALYFFNVDFDFTVQRESSFSDTTESSGFIAHMTNRVNDRSFSQNLTWFFESGHSINTGYSLKRLSLQYHETFAGSTIRDWDQSPTLFEFYITDSRRPVDRLIFETGIRVTKYELYDHWLFDPRINFKYFLTGDLAVKGSWGKYSQFLFTINQDDQLLRIVDFWQPIMKGYKPQQAEHFILGLEYFSSRYLSMTLEGYVKPYKYILDMSRVYHPAEGEGGFVSGTGIARGVEILLKKNQGDLSGWVGYSYSLTKKTMDYNENGVIEPALGEEFHAKYDMPHSFNAVLNYRINHRRTISASCTAHSGEPFTPPKGKVFHQDFYNLGSVDNPYQRLDTYYGAKNSARFPLYFRLDLAYAFNSTFFHKDAVYQIQVINLTNHYNVLMYNWNLEKSPAQVSAYSMFPILITFGMEIKL